MQSLSQADATIKELRSRTGEDVGLLSYLPDERVKTALLDNKAEPGGHPLPVRILFGKIEQTNRLPEEFGLYSITNLAATASRVQTEDLLAV